MSQFWLPPVTGGLAAVKGPWAELAPIFASRIGRRGGRRTRSGDCGRSIRGHNRYERRLAGTGAAGEEVLIRLRPMAAHVLLG